MENVLTRILDRLRATQRTRQIIVNVGLFLLAIISFVTSNPMFELGPGSLQWVAVLAFLGNALAGIVTTPNRMVPVGYTLAQDTNGIWSIYKDAGGNWLSIILSTLRATDQLKTILVNLGILVGLVIAFLVDSSIVSGELPKWLAGIAFAGNALAGMLNNPERSIPEEYTLKQDEEGVYYIEPPLGNVVDFQQRAARNKRPDTVFQF